jgi:hypothetical protein
MEILSKPLFWFGLSVIVIGVLYGRNIGAFAKLHKASSIEAPGTGWLYGLIGWIVFGFALRVFFGRGELTTFLACAMTATYTVFVVRVTNREKQVP